GLVVVFEGIASVVWPAAFRAGASLVRNTKGAAKRTAKKKMNAPSSKEIGRTVLPMNADALLLCLGGKGVGMARLQRNARLDQKTKVTTTVSAITTRRAVAGTHP